MGAYWLQSLPDVLADAGLVVGTYPGWEVRARSTGGYDDILAIQVHHTASSTSPANDQAYMWDGSPDSPVGAIYLSRDGMLTVGAAGATNTSGKGGPLTTSRGVIGLDSANRYVISIEAANNGVGETWPLEQQQAYLKAVNALCRAYGLTTDYGDVHAHWEWTDRKIDPAGNSIYANGGDKWDMDQFRRDVAAAQPNPPDPEEDDMKIYACRDSNGSVWVGDGITRRGVQGWDVWQLMVLQSVLGSGPKIHSSYDVGQEITNPDQIHDIIYDPPLLDSIGRYLDG